MSAPLSDLNILALDCQATGANPARGHLLEMGWIQTSASLNKIAKVPAAQAYLIRLPADAVVPQAVQRITGISAEALKAAVPSKTAWQYLLAAAGETVCGYPDAVCPVVIHFARFEEPFLRELHHKNNPASPFPFQIICTHEIAIRLLPQLPRRGIKAIAGYYGHRMPELKRSADHAKATALIWQFMVQLLNTTCGISKLNQLFEWLTATKPAGRSKRVYPMSPQIRQQLPDQPGIYQMLRAGGDLLYIGKAKSLKQRVNSYFRPKARHAEHILEMLTQARGLDVTLSGSALEAAILEADQIKRHSPPYNIALRRRHRQLAFCTKNLIRHTTLAHADYPVGPLPSGKTIETLTAFGLWLRDGRQLTGDNDNCIGYSVLAFRPEYAPEINCLKAGFNIFQKQHRNRLENQLPLRFLTSLGAKLWHEKLEADALAETVKDEESRMDNLDAQQSDSGDEHVWTPEAVAGTIERMVRHSAHLIRRARWFCLLSESSLTWTPGAESEKYKRLVVFEKGAVIKQGKASASGKTLIPPGYANSFRARQKNVDLVTYDRLRVVTTELRRIIAEGRNIDLRLGPKVNLGRQELKRALRWV